MLSRVLTEVDLNQVVGTIDIDCAVESGFDEEDQRHLEDLASLLSEASNWDW